MVNKIKAKKKPHNKDHRLVWFLLPSLSGLLLFYLIPFVMSLGYTMVDNTTSQNFAGFQNFMDTFHNPLFLRALGNTLLFIALCVPLNMIVSFLLAAGLKKKIRGRGIFSLIFLLPLVIPSGSVIYLWDCLFRLEGVMNRFLLDNGKTLVNWSESSAVMFIVVLLFVWKNAGYNMLLFWAGLGMIPEEYLDCAKVEGAGAWQTFRHVTFIYLSPTTFLVLLMSIINTFKSFREIYLLFGSNPNKHIYMLQHYMNNLYQSLNLPRLTTASYILTFVITIMIFALFMAQKKLSDHFS